MSSDNDDNDTLRAAMDERDALGMLVRDVAALDGRDVQMLELLLIVARAKELIADIYGEDDES